MNDKMEQFLSFLEEDITVLFDRMVEDLTDEELSRFLELNPDFIENLE